MKTSDPFEPIFNSPAQANQRGYGYLEAAVKQGSWSAMWTMAEFYEFGESPYIAQDSSKAAYWFVEAKKRMKPEQIAKENKKLTERSIELRRQRMAAADGVAEARADQEAKEHLRQLDIQDRIYGNKTTGIEPR